jgi:hypothetical protein
MLSYNYTFILNGRTESLTVFYPMRVQGELCANCIRCCSPARVGLIANSDTLVAHSVAFSPPSGFRTTRNEIPHGGWNEIALWIGNHFFITYKFRYVVKVKNKCINGPVFLQPHFSLFFRDHIRLRYIRVTNDYFIVDKELQTFRRKAWRKETTWKTKA